MKRTNDTPPHAHEDKTTARARARASRWGAFALVVPSFFAVACSALFAACSDPKYGPTELPDEASVSQVPSATEEDANDLAPVVDARPPVVDARSAAVDAADGNLDAAVSPQQAAVCGAYATRNRCTDSSVPKTCESALKCTSKYMEQAAADAFASCYGYPSCKGEELCQEVAGLAAGGNAAMDYVAKCFAKADECGPTVDVRKYCSAVLYMFMGIGSASTACLAKTCAEQQGCFDPVLRPVNRCD